MCSYWLLANTADRHVEDHDVHAYSFTIMPIGSLGEDIENIIIIIIWLALNDELGTCYLSTDPISCTEYSHTQTSLQYSDITNKYHSASNTVHVVTIPCKA